MITCEELDGLFERLCDLTRQIPDTVRIREATALLTEAESTPRRFVMQWRAAACADLFYLRNWSMRDIGTELGIAFQGVSQWLASHGPASYLAVYREGSGDPQLKVLTVNHEDARGTRATIRHYQNAGYRIAPATWNLWPQPMSLDQDRITQLWDELAPANA